MSNYIRKMKSLTLPEKAGYYEVELYKNISFLSNDRNVLYFEYAYDAENGKLPEMNKYYFSILPYNEIDIIPTGYEYLCSFEDNAHIRYFVYYYDAASSVFTKFTNMWGGFGL